MEIKFCSFFVLALSPRCFLYICICFVMILFLYFPYMTTEKTYLRYLAPRNKNTYMAIICHFLIKNYLARTKKERNYEIVISINDLIKIKSFILNNETFVFLFYEKLKKTLCQSKSLEYS